MTDAARRIQSARADLVVRQPFFGVLILSAPCEASEAIPTAATDGVRILYNPAFIDTLTVDEVLGVLAHEILHCANGHPWRRNARDPMRWNIACDLAINPILTEAGLCLPAGHLADPKMVGKSAEWIYDRLPLSGRRSGYAMPGSGGRDGEEGDRETGGPVIPGAGGHDVLDGDLETGDLAQAEWAVRMTQAVTVAKMHGTLPASLARLVACATQPKVEWRAYLRRFMQVMAREDYAWGRPNPRYVSRGLYLPSLRSESMPPVAVAIDTSGSIDAVTLGQFGAELTAIVEDLRPIRTTVIYADAKVQALDTFEQGDPIQIRAQGGGGTTFGPALDAAEHLDDPPCCVVYLTDLWGMHRPHALEMPVLWVTTDPSAPAPPYGEVVTLE